MWDYENHFHPKCIFKGIKTLPKSGRYQEILGISNSQRPWEIVHKLDILLTMKNGLLLPGMCSKDNRIWWFLSVGWSVLVFKVLDWVKNDSLSTSSIRITWKLLNIQFPSCTPHLLDWNIKEWCACTWTCHKLSRWLECLTGLGRQKSWCSWIEMGGGNPQPPNGAVGRSTRCWPLGACHTDKD